MQTRFPLEEKNNEEFSCDIGHRDYLNKIGGFCGCWKYFFFFFRININPQQCKQEVKLLETKSALRNLIYVYPGDCLALTIPCQGKIKPKKVNS